MYKDMNGMGDDNSDSSDDGDNISEEDINDDNIEEVEDSNGEIIGSPNKKEKLGIGMAVATPSPNNNKTRGSGGQADINDDIPIDWTFLGFISFIIYGPFTDNNNILPIFEINDVSRGVASITRNQKEDLINKCNDRRNDSANDRGYTTDQRISIDLLRIQKMYHVQNANESNMIALIGHEAAISKQIETVERRTAIRFKEYNEDNVYWKQVENLLAEQNIITKNILNYTSELKPLSNDKNMLLFLDDTESSGKPLLRLMIHWKS